MDQRIIEVLNKLTAAPNEAFQSVLRTENEYYFRFREVAFSVLYAEDRPPGHGPYAFYIYPAFPGNLHALTQQFEAGNETVEFHVYHSAQSGPIASTLMEKLWKKLSEIKPAPLDEAIRRVLGSS